MYWLVMHLSFVFQLLRLLPAQLEQYASSVGQLYVKGEWRSAMKISGAQFVMTLGPPLMPEWSVGSLDMWQLVSITLYPTH